MITLAPIAIDPAVATEVDPAHGSAPSGSGRGVRARRKPAEIVAEQHRRTEAAKARSLAKFAATVLQQELPLWCDERRGVPNPMIRSALFSSTAPKQRRFVKDEKVASLSNFTIRYTGEELNQTDLSVWLAIMNLGRNQPIGEPIYFTAYQVIKDVGFSMNKDSYTRVRESIHRLKVTGLKIETSDAMRGYTGALIRTYSWDDSDPATGRSTWSVTLEPEIVRLFESDMVTYLFWEQRKRIGTKAHLALFIHAFYATHRDPIPFSVEKLRDLSNSKEKCIHSFRKRLCIALDKVKLVGAIKSWVIKGNMVYVEKAPYPKQPLALAN